MSEEERENTLGMVNFDTIGTGLELRLMGDPELTQVAETAGRDLGIEYTVVSPEDDAFWSNHTEFSEVGIPVLTFYADNARQTEEGGVDDLKWINPAFLDQVERTAVGLVRRLGSTVASQREVDSGGADRAFRTKSDWLIGHSGPEPFR